MGLRFRYVPVPHWPALAWLARLTRGGLEVVVTHGARVQTRPDWFGEIVWSGDFESGDFDQTDLAFGSGGRIRPAGPLVFVPSGSTVDRLHSIEVDERDANAPAAGRSVYVSNSLPCLMAQVGASLDPTDGSFYELMATMTLGIDRYERFLPTTRGPVRMTYFDNLAWDGQALIELPKPDPVPQGFRDFADYRAYLRSAAAGVAANAQDARRRFPFRLMGTVSTGYDSTASAAIMRDAAGLSEAITFVRPDGVDGGHEIARHLGINLTTFGRYQWRELEGHLPEAPFIAGDAKGEDLFFAPTAKVLDGVVLITGHGGGGIWDRHRSNPAPTFRRKDRAGLPLTEWRLDVGFIDLPLPYIGGRHVRDLMRIGTSPEMAPWDVGSWYTRPIPRRILEEAGVPRQLFGFHKRAASILMYRKDSPMTPASTGDFHRWLRRHSGAFLRRGKLPPAQFRFLLRARRRVMGMSGSMLDWLRRALKRGDGARLDRLAQRWMDRGGRDPLFDYAFAWAMAHAIRRYHAAPDAPARPHPE